MRKFIPPISLFIFSAATIIIFWISIATVVWGDSSTFQVSQSSDDGRTLSGSWDSSFSTDYFGNQNIFGTVSAAIRFDTMVPQGAQIIAAYLSLNITSMQSGMQALCYGIDEDDTATFSADPFSRNHTTAYISCDYGDWSAASGWSNSPTMVNIVQEIIDRPGFGGAIGFLIEDNSSPSANVCNFVTYDYGGGDSGFQPKLYIEWTQTTLSGVNLQ